jgi:F-type H+-transporting ATPase subunit b
MSLLATSILAAEDPSQSHSWIFPETPEIIWGTLSFLVVAFLLWKFGWPQAKKMMAERTARIQAEIDEAETAKLQADEAAVTIRQAKGDIGAERQRMLADADEQAARLLADGRARLEQEMVELRAKAESENVASLGRLRDELQAEVARLASAAAERVVTESLDDRTQQELVEQFITRVGASA